MDLMLLGVKLQATRAPQWKVKSYTSTQPQSPAAPMAVDKEAGLPCYYLCRHGVGHTLYAPERIKDATPFALFCHVFTFPVSIDDFPGKAGKVETGEMVMPVYSQVPPR